jgi:hypothetical protein
MVKINIPPLLHLCVIPMSTTSSFKTFYPRSNTTTVPTNNSFLNWDKCLGLPLFVSLPLLIQIHSVKSFDLMNKCKARYMFLHCPFKIIDNYMSTCFRTHKSTFFTYVFHMILCVNSDCFLKQHSPTILCNSQMCSFLWGTDWIIKYHLDGLWL